MTIGWLRTLGGLSAMGLVLAFGATADESVAWDQARVAALAGRLHEGVEGLRDEIRSQNRDVGTMHGWAYYRLLDDLRLIERETRYLHQALESGASRDETRPTYARIATLRRDCAEEMRRQPIAGPALERVERARSIVKEMDRYYGFDPDHPDHDRVLRRQEAPDTGGR